MTQPTDADRQRAREIMARHDQMAGHVIKDREYLELEIAAAIAAARAEALEDAARYFEEAADFDAGPITRLVVSASIRALSKMEQSHGK